MPSSIERAVAYDRDLMEAASEVLAELDDTDGVVIGTKQFRALIRLKARKFRVSRKALTLQVQELHDP